MKFHRALACAILLATIPAASFAADTAPAAGQTAIQTARLALVNQLLTTINNLPANSGEDVFEAQIAGVTEGSGLSADEIRSALESVANAPNIPAKARAAARKVAKAITGAGRGTAALGGNGAPAYTSAPGFGGGGGSDY